MGIDGIMYAGPIADGIAVILVIAMSVRELSKGKYKEDLTI